MSYRPVLCVLPCGTEQYMKHFENVFSKSFNSRILNCTDFILLGFNKISFIFKLGCISFQIYAFKFYVIKRHYISIR